MAFSDNAMVKLAPSEGLAVACVVASIAVATVALVLSNSLFLVAALGIGLVVAAVVHFEWFVYTQIFFLPWYPLLGMNIRPRDLSLIMRFLLLAGGWVVCKRKGQSVKQWLLGSGIKKGVWFFTAAAAISLLASSLGPNKDALRSLEQLLSYVAVFFGLAGWIETKAQIETIVKVIVWSTILVALFGLYQVFAQSYTTLYSRLYPLQDWDLEEWNGRIVSFLFHFNSLAGYLNLVLPFSLAGMILAKERLLRNLAIICHTLAVAALYFTGSRGGLIAYAGMLLVALFLLKPRRVAVLRIVFTTALSIAIVLGLQPQSGAGRVREADDYTVVTRLALWGAAGSMFLEHPILGVGYGNYRALYNDYLPGTTPNQLDAHNLYLQFLAETGIIGFLAFCIVSAGFIKIAWKLARNPDPVYGWVGVGMGGAITATLIHGVVDYLFNVSPQFGGLFWLTMTLGVVALELASSTGLPQVEVGT